MLHGSICISNQKKLLWPNYDKSLQKISFPEVYSMFWINIAIKRDVRMNPICQRVLANTSMLSALGVELDCRRKGSALRTDHWNLLFKIAKLFLLNLSTFVHLGYLPFVSLNFPSLIILNLSFMTYSLAIIYIALFVFLSVKFRNVRFRHFLF